MSKTEIQIQIIKGLFWYLILKKSLFWTIFIVINLSVNKLVLIAASLVTILGWLYILNSGLKTSVTPSISSILNFPALNIREAHERPEAMEERSVMMTGVNCDRIIQAIEVLNSQKRDKIRSLKLVNDYNVDNVSEKILRVILSYTDYIKKNVWKEYWIRFENINYFTILLAWKFSC